MTRGMVGWAGGGAGPDFFVYTAEAPATHWAHDHTIIGEIADSTSWKTLDFLHALPAAVGGGGMTMLAKPVALHAMKTPPWLHPK